MYCLHNFFVQISMSEHCQATAERITKLEESCDVCNCNNLYVTSYRIYSLFFYLYLEFK
jgi:hypothetical protein